MSFKEILTDMAANLVAGFVTEIAEAAKQDAALIQSRPGLKHAGAEFASAILGQPQSTASIHHDSISVSDSVQPPNEAPTIIEVPPDWRKV